MPVGVSREENEVRVVLSGDLTVSEAEALHRTLCDLAAVETPVVIEESELMAVDTSVVQLVLAFGRTRVDAGLAVRVAEGDVLARLRQLGLDGSLAG